MRRARCQAAAQECLRVQRKVRKGAKSMGCVFLGLRHCALPACQCNNYAPWCAVHPPYTPHLHPDTATSWLI